MIRTCVVPGSFDPITSGHLDIIERAARVFDRVVVGVLVNRQKKALLDMEQRVALIKKSCAHLPGIEVERFEGLLVEYARTVGASAIIRGLRAVSDYEYEGQLAAMNRRLAPEIETLFFMTDVRYGYLSSSMVKEIALLGGDIAGLVPEAVLEDIRVLCAPEDKRGGTRS